MVVAYKEGSTFFRTPEALYAYVQSLESTGFLRRSSRRPMAGPDTRAASSDSAAPAHDPHGLVGQTLSHYRIDAVVGSGAMGIVYKAVDTRLDRTVALKLLPPAWSGDQTARSRLVNEARAISALHHTNILTLLDIGEDRGMLFLSMVFCEGETLAERLNDGPLPAWEAAAVGVQVARGLAAAHRRGILHRDIKPSNVMITPEGEVKILDFGLARMADLRLTSVDYVVGTPLYMSPEQLRGEEVDHRSDLWSFGVLLYEVITGRCPFLAEYPHAVIYSILYHEPNFEAVPVDLRPLLRSMLSKNREDRPESAEAVERELALVRQPVDDDEGRSWNEVGFGAAAAMFILLSALFVWQSFSANGTRVAPEEYIVVSEFANNTSEPVLDHSLSEAMRVSIRQSRHINVLSIERMKGALDRMRLPENHPFDEQTALGIARREGARLVITGSADRLGSKYVLTTRIVEPSTGEVLRIRRVEVEKIEEVLSGMDRLVRQLRADLGESLTMISAHSAPMDRVTTSSIEALELYGRANDLVLEGRYQEALLLKERAVEIDSTFAAAISDLSSTYRRLGNNEKALYYHRRIPALLDRVSDRERFMILATYYHHFEMDYDAAFENARQWVTMYPRDEEAHAWLGHAAMYLGRTADAIRSNQRSAEIDTTYTGVMLGNSAFAQALDGRGDAALDLFRSSKRYRPDYAALDGFIAQAQWLRMEYDSAEAAFNTLRDDADPLRRKKTIAHLVALHLFRGRLDAAAAEAAAGIDACLRSRDPGGEAYFRYLAGEIARARGRNAAAREELRAAIRLSTSPFLDIALAGMALAEIGYVDDAREAMSRLQTVASDDPQFTRRKPALLQLLAGAIAHAEDRSDIARAELERVDEIHHGDPIYLLAKKKRADVLAGWNMDEAEALYLKILERRGEAVMAHLPRVRDGGIWTSRLWPETHLSLGRLYVEQGMDGRAEHHLREALIIWKDADEDFIHAREAEELLNRVPAEL